MSRRSASSCHLAWVDRKQVLIENKLFASSICGFHCLLKVLHITASVDVRSKLSSNWPMARNLPADCVAHKDATLKFERRRGFACNMVVVVQVLGVARRAASKAVHTGRSSSFAGTALHVSPTASRKASRAALLTRAKVGRWVLMCRALIF